jgi:hypothetical protein
MWLTPWTRRLRSSKFDSSPNIAAILSHSLAVYASKAHELKISRYQLPLVCRAQNTVDDPATGNATFEVSLLTGMRCRAFRRRIALVLTSFDEISQVFTRPRRNDQGLVDPSLSYSCGGVVRKSKEECGLTGRGDGARLSVVLERKEIKYGEL